MHHSKFERMFYNATNAHRVKASRVLPRYASFKLTGHDAHIAIEERESWYVADMVTRDTSLLGESNFAVLTRELEKYASGDFETHRFGHWACGWFDIMLVRPRSMGWRIAVGAVYSREQYAILDESDLAEREEEMAQRNFCINDFVFDMNRAYELSDSSRDWIRSNVDLDMVFRAANVEVTNNEGAYIFRLLTDYRNVKRVRSDMAEMLLSLRDMVRK